MSEAAAPPTVPQPLSSTAQSNPTSFKISLVLKCVTECASTPDFLAQSYRELQVNQSSNELLTTFFASLS